MTPTVDKHPAPFTDSIIDAFRVLIPEWVPRGHWVHDPFAGEGVRLGALCDELGYTFRGTDLELWKGGDSRVYLDDSTDPESYPPGPHAVVTSPTYNNGVNDHFAPKDSSRRLTYRVRAGHALHVNNTGRYSGRGSKRGEAEYWRITREVVKCWPAIVLVNVKDSYRLDVLYPFVQMWTDLLTEFGYVVTDREVECPGWRFGTNSQSRAATESILIGVGHRNPKPRETCLHGVTIGFACNECSVAAGRVVSDGAGIRVAAPDHYRALRPGHLSDQEVRE